MINIKELAVGNWVKFPYGIDKIDELCMWANYAAPATNRPVHVLRLEPIEITPEILEKNGFEFHSFMSDYPADYVIAVGKYKVKVNHLDDENLWCFTLYYNENIRVVHQFNIRFVHQLQNVLTLCGIDKEIEL